MINNRIAFLSAFGFALLVLLMAGGSEASLNDPYHTPTEEERVDPTDNVGFGVSLNAAESETVNSFKVVFSNGAEYDLICDEESVGDCEGSGDELDGFWRSPEDISAQAVVGSLGIETIKYRFIAEMSGDNTYYSPDADTFHNSGVRVNSVPLLSDDVVVTGENMPFSTRTVTVTYQDLDGHAATITGEVCDDSANCENIDNLVYSSGTISEGAVYTQDFTTALGGDLTITLTATDGFDSAAAPRTGSFTVSESKPWLVLDAVSPTSVTTSDDVTFSVVYCVFEAQTGTSVDLDVGGVTHEMVEGASADDDCINGVGTSYSVSTAVAWNAAAQAVQFSASNDEDDNTLDSLSTVTVNDLPTFNDESNSAERVGDNFVIQIAAADINSDAGDSITVHALIQYSPEPYVMNFIGPHYEVTVAESAIIAERGGLRAVTFQVSDLHGDIVPGDYGDVIDVTKTSSFDMEIKDGGSTDVTTAPGTNTYTYTITNNGNYDDTYTITTSSTNNWLATPDPVTVPHGSFVDFGVTVTIPNVLAGTVDTWSVGATATNDNSVEDEVSGTTTVAVLEGHELTGDTGLSGNPDATVTYQFTLINTGNAPDTFIYSVSSANGWVVSDDHEGNSVALEVGASQLITVSHKVPADAASSDSDTVTFAITDGLTSQVVTSVNQIYGVTVSEGTLTGLKPGQQGDLTFTITNTGNGDDTFTISHSGVWATAIQSENFVLGSGGQTTVDVTVQIPSNTASGASSAVGVSVSSVGGTGSSASYDVVVASSTRSLEITGANTYTFNQGTVGQGTVSVQNTGVTTTFIVTSMSDSVSFDTSSYTVNAGASQDFTFNIMATASGDQSFTISDNVDFNFATHTFALTARTFSENMSSWGLAECGNNGVTCTYDDSWDGSAYTNAGTWTTSMVYVDPNGQSGTHSFDTTIDNTDPVVAEPTLDNPVQGTEQLFSFKIPTDADGSITHFVIDFGDGESQTFQSSDLVGETVTATHTYSKSGNFDVVATAYDNSGGSTQQTVAVSVGDEMVTLEGSSYTYNLVALLGFFLLGAILSGTAFKMQQGEIAGDEEMNERDRQRLESVERRMESLSEREELMEVSAYDASRAATKLEEHIAAFNSILVKAQEIAAEDKLKELEAAEEARKQKDEEMQLDLEDPDIEMVAERFHESLARLVAARDDLSKIEKHLARILKMERDEQLEKLTEMTESYESTKRKIDALESSKEARDAAAVENNIMNMLSAAASGGSMANADFGDFGDFDGDDEYEVEIFDTMGEITCVSSDALIEIIFAGTGNKILGFKVGTQINDSPQNDNPQENTLTSATTSEIIDNEQEPMFGFGMFDEPSPDVTEILENTNYSDNESNINSTYQENRSNTPTYYGNTGESGDKGGEYREFAAKIVKGDVKNYLRLGNAAWLEKRLERAMEHFLKATEINPDEPRAWHNLAVCNYHLALKRNPDDLESAVESAIGPLEKAKEKGGEHYNKVVDKTLLFLASKLATSEEIDEYNN